MRNATHMPAMSKSFKPGRAFFSFCLLFSLLLGSSFGVPKTSMFSSVVMMLSFNGSFIF